MVDNQVIMLRESFLNRKPPANIITHQRTMSHQLQKLFSSPSILHHHDEKRVLYVDLDASKEFGFGAHIFHSTDESSDPPKQKAEQSILFLSRLLTDAETRYWPTELEIAGIVWVVKKIRHMIEASAHCTVVYTDHSAAVSIVCQTSLNTTSTEELNDEYLHSHTLTLTLTHTKIKALTSLGLTGPSRPMMPARLSMAVYEYVSRFTATITKQ